MDSAAINATLPYWDALDRLNLRGELAGSVWPWESDSPEVQAVWDGLTRQENLATLEDWGRDMRGWGGLAAVCTVVAIETCRVRAGGVGPVADCIPEALAAVRRRYPGAEFTSLSRSVG